MGMIKTGIFSHLFFKAGSRSEVTRPKQKMILMIGIEILLDQGVGNISFSFEAIYKSAGGGILKMHIGFLGFIGIAITDKGI